MEDGMRRLTWNDLLVGLTLVHLGQQLGSDTKAARAVFDICSLASFCSGFLDTCVSSPMFRRSFGPLDLAVYSRTLPHHYERKP
jgi:hypothetical protein